MQLDTGLSALPELRGLGRNLCDLRQVQSYRSLAEQQQFPEAPEQQVLFSFQSLTNTKHQDLALESSSQPTVNAVGFL